MSTKARAAFLVVAVIASSPALAVGEPELSSCCLLPGGAKGLAPHVQNMRWETHGLMPVATGERHAIEPTWPTTE
jgi:hypothetical protein